jgi:hypothetical protein
MDIGQIGMIQCEHVNLQPALRRLAHRKPTIEMETTEAVLDNGATSFVVGSRTLEKYLGQLQARGYDAETVKIFSCTKAFRFGNDKTGAALGCALVPMFFGGKYVEIMVYILEGATPFLFARPLMEELKLCIDFGKQRARWNEEAWFPVTKQELTGHYVLDMLESYSSDYLNQKPQHVLLPVDAAHHIDYTRKWSPTKWFEKVPDIMEIRSDDDEPEPTPKPTSKEDTYLAKDIPIKKLKAITQNVIEHNKEFKTNLAKSKTYNRSDMKVWEVYAGAGRLSDELKKRKVQTTKFSRHNGWDFDIKQHRERFLKKLADEEPEHVFMSPECRVWSQMQEMNLRTPEDHENLKEERRRHHNDHLTFVRQIYDMQQQGGRHAHIEQPAYAKSWKTKALKDLAGYFVYFDQCMLGLTIPGCGLARKRTAIRTTKKGLVDALIPHQCDGQHEHVTLKGSVPGSGVAKTKFAEDYPVELCSVLADGMLAKEECDVCYYTAGDIFLEDEDQTTTTTTTNPDTGDQYHNLRAPEACARVRSKHLEVRREVAP